MTIPAPTDPFAVLQLAYQNLYDLMKMLGPDNPDPALRIFKTFSDDPIEIQRVPPGEQPALFQDEAFEDYMYSGAVLTFIVATVYFHIGCTSTKGQISASKTLNPLISAVRAKLQSTVPGDEQQLNLGDRVTAVRIKGTAMKNLGANSTDTEHRQAVYYLPVEIVIAAQ